MIYKRSYISMNTISLIEHADNPHQLHCQIQTPKGIYNIPLNHILFIECSQKKSFIHTNSEIFTLPLPLYRIKEVLPPHLFIQTHRSFLVNLNHISHIDKQTDPWTIFFFQSEKRAYISRNSRQVILKAVSD